MIHQSAEDARASVNSEGKLHVRGCRLGWAPHGSTLKKGDLRGAGEDRTGDLPPPPGRQPNDERASNGCAEEYPNSRKVRVTTKRDKGADSKSSSLHTLSFANEDALSFDIPRSLTPNLCSIGAINGSLCDRFALYRLR